jgi:hypothetical protein
MCGSVTLHQEGLPSPDRESLRKNISYRLLTRVAR